MGELRGFLLFIYPFVISFVMSWVEQIGIERRPSMTLLYEGFPMLASQSSWLSMHVRAVRNSEVMSH